VAAKEGEGQDGHSLGQKLLDNASHEVLKELVKTNPEIGKDLNFG